MKKITPEMLDALKQEVATLENKNTNEILIFEKNLQDLQNLYPLDDTQWSSALDSIEIITMEKHPSLSNSIRKVII